MRLNTAKLRSAEFSINSMESRPAKVLRRVEPIWSIELLVAAPTGSVGAPRAATFSNNFCLKSTPTKTRKPTRVKIKPHEASLTRLLTAPSFPSVSRMANT